MPAEFKMHIISIYAEIDRTAYICRFLVIQFCILRKKKSCQKIRIL